MTCYRCGLPKQKGNIEVDVTVKEAGKDDDETLSFYLCEFCWKEINDFVFKKKELIN